MGSLLENFSPVPEPPRVPFGSLVVVRRAFLQSLEDGGGAAPLAAFVRERRGLALDLFLVALAAQEETGGAVTATTNDWLHATRRTASRSMAASVTRAWTWLEERQLIRTSRAGRQRSIEVLREDGSGREWTRRVRSNDLIDKSDPAFVVPRGYIDVALGRPISLSAKAVLLIALSLQPRITKEARFQLPVERGAAWYGLPVSAVRDGLRELRELRLIHTWVEKVPDEAGYKGFRYDRWHRLVDLGLAAWRLAQPSDEGEGPPDVST